MLLAPMLKQILRRNNFAVYFGKILVSVLIIADIWISKESGLEIVEAISKDFIGTYNFWESFHCDLEANLIA